MRLKACTNCGSPRTRDPHTPCPGCGHRATGQRGSTSTGRRARTAAIHQAITLDGGLYCAQCDEPLTGGRDTHHDHITPLARGGTSHPSNMQILCAPCNLRKGAT